MVFQKKSLIFKLVNINQKINITVNYENCIIILMIFLMFLEIFTIFCIHFL